MGHAASGRLLPPGEYWFEDVAAGDHYETAGVTVTEAHVVGFAGLAGDLFDVHVDEKFAREQGFPGRIAHGLLGLAMADGLKTRSKVSLAGIATLGWNWSFRAPILIGDRIRTRIKVADKRLTSRGARGIVTFEMQILNDQDIVTQEGTTLLMMRCRSIGEDESISA